MKTPHLFRNLLLAGVAGLALSVSPTPTVEAAALSSSSVWGGSLNDQPKALTQDKDGNLYLLVDYFQDNYDLLVLKFNPTGDTLLDNILIGGMEDESGRDISVDDEGNVYLLAQSSSFDNEVTPNFDEGFPLTPNALLHDREEIYWKRFSARTVLCKLNPEMDTLLYSTRFEGTYPRALELDADGNVYIATSATTWFHELEGKVYQHRNGCAQNNPAPLVAKFDLTKSGTESLLFATYFAGTACGDPVDLAVDADGNAYLAGTVDRQVIPTPGAPQRNYVGGYRDAFVTKVNSTGTELLFATHFGGSAWDEAGSIEIDADRNIFITGWTYSEDLPTTPGVILPENPNGEELANQLFVTKYTADGAIAYCTYLGGSETDSYGNTLLKLGSDGSVYLTGTTDSPDFPMVNPIQKTKSPGTDGSNTDSFVAVLNPAATALTFSTYLGGSNFDGPEAIHLDEGRKVLTLLGHTTSRDFPTKNPLVIEALPGSVEKREPSKGDFYMARIDLAAAPPPDVLKGDANLDEKLDVQDAITVLQSTVGQVDLTPEQVQAADVIKDETVNVADAVKILKVVVGTDTFE